MRGFSVLHKAVAVTGAGSGIGRALCNSLKRAGARSILCLDLDIASAESTARQLGSAAKAIECDAGDRASLQAALRAADPIDVFCSNAGVATLEHWRYEHVCCVHGLHRVELPRMLPRVVGTRAIADRGDAGVRAKDVDWIGGS